MGNGVIFFPPQLLSAVGVTDRTIRLTWRYRREDLRRFKIRRKNLMLGTTGEFEVFVDPGSETHAYDDNGRPFRDHRDPILEPDTSYQYSVGAVHGPNDPEGLVGTIWAPDTITGNTPNTPFQPTFEGTLGSDEPGWGGYTLVQRIEPDALSRSGRQVQVTLRASSVGTTIGGAYIQSAYISKPDPAGQHPYDSGEDLTEVSPKFFLRADQSVTLPFVRYHLDRSSPLLIAVELSEPAGVKYRSVKTRMGGPFGLPPLVPIGTAYWHTGLEAGLRNRSANYGSMNRIYLVEKIEVR